MDKICAVCGRSFTVRTRSKFCSEECRRRFNADYNKKWNKAHVTERRAYMREYMRTGKLYVSDWGK
jgi:hypothetical protein